MQQSRQQKKRQKLQADLHVGEEVYTVGGLIGTVVSVDNNKLTLKLSDNVVVPVLRSAIGGKYQRP